MKFILKYFDEEFEECNKCDNCIKKKNPIKDVKNSLKKRTNLDKNRKNSPLIKVKDAILIRTDKLTKKQVLTKMSKHIDNVYKK